MLTDTVAAISTGGVTAGINIIRISGKNTKFVISKVFNNYKKLKHQHIIYGKVVDPKTGKELDEVLVSMFIAPNSYTGEDVCEINCHGGRKITLKILNLILSFDGVRLSEPGEFSKRAFLNGKMDLSKAEAIIDIINAKTNLQTKIALNQMNGRLFEEIKTISTPLIELMANIEVGIDYPEYEYEELSQRKIKEILIGANKKIEKLIESYDKGKYIKNGINVVIIGLPNVGKSSVMNALSREERSIVTDIEGTTRDVVEQKVIIGNMELNILDTAGIRKTEDVVEKIGIKKCEEAIEKSELVLFIFDATRSVSQEEVNLVEKLRKSRKSVIECYNKSDISCENPDCKNKIKISAKTREGLDLLEKEIEQEFNKLNLNENTEEIIVNERHKTLLDKAKKNIDLSVNEINQKMQIEVVALAIKEAIDNLLEITGEKATDEIINEVFEKFCLGK